MRRSRSVSRSRGVLRGLLPGLFLAGVLQAYAETPDTPGSVLEALETYLELLIEHAVHYDGEAVLRAAAEAVVSAVDERASLVDREAYESFRRVRQGYAVHPGIHLRFTNGWSYVDRIQAESPAAAAGLQEGDLLVSMDGQPVEGLIPPEVLGLLRPTAPGTLELEVGRGATQLQFSVEAAELQLPAVEAVEFLHGGMVYVLMNGFFEGAGRVLAEDMRSWRREGHYGVILDLRQAVGDSVEAVNDLLNELSEPGESLYAFQDGAGRETTSFTADASDRLDMPLMLLVGPATGGAAELFAAACKKTVKGVLLLGSATAGDPLLRSYVPVRGDEGLLMTTRTLRAGGVLYDGTQGVQPDMVIADAWYAGRYGHSTGRQTTSEERALRERIRGDGPLSRAADLLRGLRALNIRPSLPASAP